jgi:hypothetical protein
MRVEVLAAQTTASIPFPSPCFDVPSDPAHAFTARFPGNTDSSCAPAARITPSTPPSVSRQPSSPLQTHKQLEFALPPSQLSNSARIQPQSIARPVVSLLNLAGKSRSLPVRGRDGATLVQYRAGEFAIAIRHCHNFNISCSSRNDRNRELQVGSRGAVSRRHSFVMVFKLRLQLALGVRGVTSALPYARFEVASCNLVLHILPITNCQDSEHQLCASNQQRVVAKQSSSSKTF